MIRRETEAELVALADIRTREECEAESFEVPFNSIDELKSNLEFDVVILYSEWFAF